MGRSVGRSVGHEAGAGALMKCFPLTATKHQHPSSGMHNDRICIRKDHRCETMNEIHKGRMENLKMLHNNLQLASSRPSTRRNSLVPTIIKSPSTSRPHTSSHHDLARTRHDCAY